VKDDVASVETELSKAVTALKYILQTSINANRLVSFSCECGAVRCTYTANALSKHF